VLFAAMSVIWGIPYLLIKVALEELSPAFLVLARTALASLVLVPVALRAGVVRPALTAWPALLAFAAIEMVGPWFLLNHAEEAISSSLAGLLIATVPLVATVIAFAMGDRHVLSRVRVVGLAVGLAGVAAIVGLDVGSGTATALGVAEMLLVAVGYAVAPVIAARWLTDVPTLGVIAVSVAAVAVVYSPAAVLDGPEGRPSGRVTAAVVVLALVCTALAFLLFFALIAEVGPVRATVFTFVNPAVAVLLGVSLLGEPFTRGMALGFPLVLLGSWLATRPVDLPESAR
jgi:drug/metabolite transporter (DMT)-like permease